MYIVSVFSLVFMVWLYLPHLDLSYLLLYNLSVSSFIDGDLLF